MIDVHAHFIPDGGLRDQLAHVFDPPDLLARLRANTEQLFPRFTP